MIRYLQGNLSENSSLCWPNVPVSFTFKRETRSVTLELDVLELYRQSTCLPTQPPQKKIALACKPDKCALILLGHKDMNLR